MFFRFCHIQFFKGWLFLSTFHQKMWQKTYCIISLEITGSFSFFHVFLVNILNHFHLSIQVQNQLFYFNLSLIKDLFCIGDFNFKKDSFRQILSHTCSIWKINIPILSFFPATSFFMTVSLYRTRHLSKRFQVYFYVCHRLHIIILTRHYLDWLSK